MNKDKKGLVAAIFGTIGLIVASLAAGKIFSDEDNNSDDKKDDKK